MARKICRRWMMLTMVASIVGLSFVCGQEPFDPNLYQNLYQFQSFSPPSRRVQHFGGYGGPFIMIYPSEQEPIFVHDTIRPGLRPSRSKIRSKTPLFPVTTRPIREWLSSLTARRVTVTKTDTATELVTRYVTRTKIIATRCVGVVESAKLF